MRGLDWDSGDQMQPTDNHLNKPELNNQSKEIITVFSDGEWRETP